MCWGSMTCWKHLSLKEGVPTRALALLTWLYAHEAKSVQSSTDDAWHTWRTWSKLTILLHCKANVMQAFWPHHSTAIRAHGEGQAQCAKHDPNHWCPETSTSCPGCHTTVYEICQWCTKHICFFRMGSTLLLSPLVIVSQQQFWTKARCTRSALCNHSQFLILFL